MIENSFYISNRCVFMDPTVYHMEYLLLPKKDGVVCSVNFKTMFLDRMTSETFQYLVLFYTFTFYDYLKKIHSYQFENSITYGYQ